jgi:hypothetical protein
VFLILVVLAVGDYFIKNYYVTSQSSQNVTDFGRALISDINGVALERVDIDARFQSFNYLVYLDKVNLDVESLNNLFKGRICRVLVHPDIDGIEKVNINLRAASDYRWVGSWQVNKASCEKRNTN